MRTRAMDNQYCLVAARDEAQGSCIINHKGDIQAWNEGDQDIIQATVNLDDAYRAIGGACFCEVTWMQRCPHLYATFTAERNLGSLLG